MLRVEASVRVGGFSRLEVDSEVPARDISAVYEIPALRLLLDSAKISDAARTLRGRREE